MTAVSQQQTQALATFWKDSGTTFNGAWCSTLLRAHETAQMVADVLDIPFTASDLLREWDNGPLAGLSREEALRRSPIPAFRHDLDAFTVCGGESQAAPSGRGH